MKFGNKEIVENGIVYWLICFNIYNSMIKPIISLSLPREKNCLKQDNVLVFETCQFTFSKSTKSYHFFEAMKL